MAAELFGVGVLGRVMGIIVTADGVAEAVSPMFVGYLRDVTGSYDAGFIWLVGAALVGAAAIAMLPRRIADSPDLTASPEAAASPPELQRRRKTRGSK
jgi:hypothetical protein